MKSVGIRELKNRLSACLREVRAGRRLAVTDRGRIVAELVPPKGTDDRAGVLADLVRRGVITLKKNDPRAYRRPSRRPLLPRGMLRRLLDEERADRWPLT
jgi:prevent-host-death family protein